MNICFRLGERRDTFLIYQFFLEKGLSYRGFNTWLQKAIEEYREEIKRTILGFSDDVLVSAIMFQDCKHMNGFTELKSARTIGEFSRRYFFSFELRQVESIARQEGMLGIICDARSDRLEVLNALRIAEYKETARTDLYSEGYEDVIMTKIFGINSSFK